MHTEVSEGCSQIHRVINNTQWLLGFGAWLSVERKRSIDITTSPTLASAPTMVKTSSMTSATATSTARPIYGYTGYPIPTQPTVSQ